MCQSRCVYCDIWKVAEKNPKLIDREMKFEEIKNYFLRDKDFLNQLEFVQLTGGEPLLKADIEKLAELCYKVSSKLESLWIPSNGLATSLVVKKVQMMIENPEIKKVGVSLSIDGQEKYHDKVRGRRGFFKKTKKTIKNLVKMKEGTNKLELSLGFTIGSENWKDLMFAYKMSKEFGIDFTTRPVNFSEVYYLNTNERPNIGLNQNEIAEIEKILKDLESKMLKDKTYLQGLNTKIYLRGILRYLNGPFERFFPCYSGSLSLAIDPLGNVFPCLYMSEKLGNIRENRLEDIWKSKKAGEVWKRINKGLCPNCWVECESQKNITYELPRVLKNFKFKSPERPSP